MKYILTLLLAAAFCSCHNDEAYINHKVEFKKLGDCTAGEKIVNMTSNIAGERYEFESCVDANFDGKNYKVERKGDSIVVSFPKSGSAQAEFKITLDIDAFPVYNFIVLDGKEAIPIKHQE